MTWVVFTTGCILTSLFWVWFILSKGLKDPKKLTRCFGGADTIVERPNSAGNGFYFVRIEISRCILIEGHEGPCQAAQHRKVIDAWT